MKKYIAEAIGTFALVFCGTGAIIINQETNGTVTHPGIAIVFGLIIMVMIYAFGNISGAHFNPAVSIAFVFAKQLEVNKLFAYIIAQLTGAILASLLLKFLFPANQLLGATLPAGSNMQSFILEFILSFLLMLVILHVFTKPVMLAGLAIGSVILLEAMFAGPICGASMNPARSFAPALISLHFEHLWVYILAPVTGATFAVLIWNFFKE
jgi:aquaporin NIP